MGYILVLINTVMWTVILAFSDIDTKILEKAEDVCKVNGGIEKLRSEVLGTPKVYCKNGAKVKLKDSE